MRAAGLFNTKETDTEEVKRASRGEIRRTRKTGLRKASVRDFHSLRVTWVTLALSAGVPLEIVQKVTGHSTASIVMKHYFQPGREDFRKTLASKMPAVLGGEAQKPNHPTIFNCGRSLSPWRQRRGGKFATNFSRGSPPSRGK